jgi:hypothetical protein
VTSVCFSPDGKRILSGTGSTGFRLVNRSRFEYWNFREMKVWEPWRSEPRRAR